MIETVSFKNFKALRDVSVSLERFTVLVGPNASGKTSVLQGLDYLFFWRHADATFFKKERDFYVLRSRGAGSDSTVVIETVDWIVPETRLVPLFEPAARRRQLTQ